jgi:hypothetical protein
MTMFWMMLGTATAHEPLSDPFRELEEILPSPSSHRTAAGRPGPTYWQQKADYSIDVTLDDEKQWITGTETIEYTNNSPEKLHYLWLQLDQNILASSSSKEMMRGAPHMSSYDSMRRIVERETYDGELSITMVADAQGQPLEYSIVQTMMRVELPEPLSAERSLSFRIDWNYGINDAKAIWARTGYEYFQEDGNYLYEIAQWHPRMAPYTDVHGWHHKQYLGDGEFSVEFGDFDVRITVPSDHTVAATGVLQNPEEVLASKALKRLEEAAVSPEPVFIVKPKEAERREGKNSKETKTWHFKAENVRDFAFASSRKFIWDAWGRDIGGKKVMAMSYYPKEAEPLWSTYSTHAVAHALEVYSDMVFPYPYPVAISVNGPIMGMEYPMICFNGPRPMEDGTYVGKPGDGQPWKHSKYGLISVIIHEVGHNWFPMIINSDERSWTWMDEGLNSFVQYHAEMLWEEDYPSRRGEPDRITGYMSNPNSVPIMTDADSLKQKGNNAYAKPATALNVLRETVLGAESFDYAFKEYAEAWQFRRPMPADFFRIMEDAAGTDLDWFWQTWFYSTAHVDIGISNVRLLRKDTGDPTVDKAARKKDEDEEPIPLSRKRYAGSDKYIDRYPSLEDFYNGYDPLDVTDADIEAYEELLSDLDEEEQALLSMERHFTIVEFENIGGAITPLILQVTYAECEGDGCTEEIRLPADIWRRNPRHASRLLVSDSPVASILLDPHREMADTDRRNNRFPQEIAEDRFGLEKTPPPKNPMQQAEEAEEKEQEEDP